MSDKKCPECGADKMLMGPGFWECRVCMARVGKKLAGRLLDGRTHNEMPGDDNAK